MKRVGTTIAEDSANVLETTLCIRGKKKKEETTVRWLTGGKLVTRIP